jgi:hypothetical protein
VLSAYAGWRPLTLSRDGGLIALARDVVVRGHNRSELVVLRLSDVAIILRTDRHLVYDLAFGPDGEHFLVEGFNTEPVRYRLDGMLGPVGTDFRLYQGDQDPVTGRFVAPSERVDGRVHATDIVTGDYVLDLADGRLLRQIEGRQGRPRMAKALFGTSALLHGGVTIDLGTGRVTGGVR